ncbi:leucine-rich repeat protein [Raoultibacter phocaeensis]|uniref:leucine-rich repeat protein n=1 Tax=Raoultibacter phocaeensis TaxID=2479841 RepID=UPI00111AABF8|nr:leucine-rich repeat protein [Raoultibacter phocaeensis]
MQVEIPATGEVDGVPYRVSQVASHGFEGQPIESVSVPSSVTAIGEAAFRSCSSLASVSLSEGLASIGASAFEGCGVDAFMLPASVTSIGERAFADCSSLACIVALSEIPAVADSAIVGCSGVSIVCPYSDSGEYAWNPGLVANGNHIDPYGLKLCPDPLTLEVGQSADLFEGGVCEVPEGAELAYAYSAVPLSVDAGVATGKKEGATEVAVALELDGVELDRETRTVEVTLAGGDPAPALDDVAEPNPLPDEPALLSGEAIAPRAVGDTFASSDKKVVFQITDENLHTAKAYKYTIGGVPNSKGDIVIPSRVQNPNTGLWYTVTTIGQFSNCSDITSFTIPNSVTSIEPTAFFGCSSLTSISIPDSVTSIGYTCFYNCTSLASVKLSNSLSVIPRTLFSGCTSLYSVAIPSSVTTIEERSFEGCAALTQVVIPDSVTSFGYRIFENCSSLSYVGLSNSMTLLDQEVFAGCPKLLSIEIPNSVKTIYSNAFYKSSLQTIVLGSGVQDLGEIIIPLALKDIYDPHVAIASMNVNTSINGVNLANVTVHLPNNAANLNVWKGAGFTKIDASFTVAFDMQGGTPAIAPRLVKYGTTTAAPAVPTRNGYTFGGWYREQACTNRWNFATDTNSGPMTLYAKWTTVPYGITYNLNGGSVAGNPASYTVETAAFTLKNPTRAGYTFAGWSGTGLNGTANQTVTVAQGSTGARSYTANWTPVISGTVPLAATVAVGPGGEVMGTSCEISSTSVVPIKVDSIACAEEVGAKDVFPEDAERAAIAVTLKPGNAAAVSVGLGGLLQRERLGDFAIGANSTLSTAIGLALPDEVTINPTATDDDPDASKAFARLTYTLALA